MAVWRYTALRQGHPGATKAPAMVPYPPSQVAPAPRVVSGEIAGATAAEVRASLRRIGLAVTDLKQLSSRPTPTSPGAIAPGVPIPGTTTPGVATPGDDSTLGARWLARLDHRIRSGWQRHLRERRNDMTSEWCDAVATLVEAGLPLLESLDTLSQSAGVSRSMRLLLVGLRDRLRGGMTLSEAMANEPAWFDDMTIAIIRAGEQSGDLAPVLRRLAQRSEQARRLRHRLLTVLTYPAVVAIVGLGVVVFLSVRTLPSLVSILEAADVEVPALTRAVMTVGGGIARGWPAVIAGALLLIIWLVLRAGGRDRAAPGDANSRQVWSPRLVRQLAVAEIARRMAALVASGVPLVESVRIVGPTTSLPALRGALRGAAERVERGDDIAEAFNDPRWFDPEFRRLLAIGQEAGDLDHLLIRIADRTSRRAERLIERVAGVLEPAVILTLAAMVGLVVLAAILPLVKLQEILR